MILRIGEQVGFRARPHVGCRRRCRAKGRVWPGRGRTLAVLKFRPGSIARESDRAGIVVVDTL